MLESEHTPAGRFVGQHTQFADDSHISSLSSWVKHTTAYLTSLFRCLEGSSNSSRLRLAVFSALFTYSISWLLPGTTYPLEQAEKKSTNLPGQTLSHTRPPYPTDFQVLLILSLKYFPRTHTYLHFLCHHPNATYPNLSHLSSCNGHLPETPESILVLSNPSFTIQLYALRRTQI